MTDKDLGSTTPAERATSLSKATQVYYRAAELVEVGWCQMVGARDERGRPVPELSPRATRFCATGAIVRAIYDVTSEDAYRPLHDLEWELANELRLGWAAVSDVRQIPSWNNRPGQRRLKVAALLRSAGDALNTGAEGAPRPERTK